jgi:signal transduction histidine kinase
VNDLSASRLSDTFPVIAPASREAKRRAAAISVALFAGFCGAVPFSRVSLPPLEAVVPIYKATFAVVCLMAAGFLLLGFERSRLRAALVLASGYLFIALIVIPEALSFSRAFSGGGWPGVGPQSGAWLDAFRRAGLPVFMIGYALVKRFDDVGGRSRTGIRADVLSAAAGVVAGVLLLTFVAIAGQRFLPRLILGDGYTTTMPGVGVLISLIGCGALALLAARRPHSILDLWLLVVLCAWLFDVALGTVVNAGRVDIGFYVGCLYGLFAASVVPVVLLVEASRIARLLDEAIAIAERRNVDLARSREELARAQRFEAIGQLTGGVAHDFNNLLTVVIGNLELILGAPGNVPRIERLAQAAMKAAQRGEHLVRQLLTYARRQVGRPQTVNLNRLINDGEALIRRVIGERIEFVTKLSPAPAWVEIDPTQFETAILNLAINSRDAIAEAGRITIETRTVIVDATDGADPVVTPGPYVVVAFSDTGAGMTPAVLERAFDPFFTTKDAGKGSGLGLSQVYGVTQMAGGRARLRSEPGLGTTVELYLPRAADRSAIPQLQAETTSPASTGGRETILVVEDDEDVLATTAESLTELGYRVLTAVSAAQALELLHGDHAIDLLFSDVMIPGGTNGAQLAVEARRVRPALKVLLTSGYTASALSLGQALPDDLAVVDKPYHREELARRLRTAIAGSPG